MPTPKKPDEVHILEGTFRPDRHGDPTTDVVADGEPVCPPYIRGKAREFWDEVVPGIVARGLAKACDSAMLAAMCRWHALAMKLDNSIDRMKLGAKGYNQRMVASAIAHDKWVRIAQSFGLDCLARTRLRQPAGKKAERVMARKRG